MDKQLWLTKPSKDLLPCAKQKIDAYYQFLRDTGIQGKIQRVYRVFHGMRPQDNGGLSFSSKDVRTMGPSGELVYLNVNHLRNMIEHTLNLVTNQRPAADVKAVNTDYRSQVQTLLGKDLLDYYLRQKHLESHLKRGVLNAVLHGEGWVTVEWDPSSGEDFAVDTVEGPDGQPVQKVIKEGDVKFTCPNMLDVVRDVGRRSAQHEWLIVRSFENKFVLSEEFEANKEKILEVQKDATHEDFGPSSFQDQDTDEIPVWTLYVAPSKLLPSGRQIKFCLPDIVLEDVTLPYREIPCYPVMPSRIEGTPFGYTPAFDALPLQEAINTLSSVILSNQRAFATQHVWIQPGSMMSPEDLSSGLNLIESTTEPRPLQLCSTPAEVFQYRKELIADMEQLMGLNSVVRGQPEASLKSGSALALVVSQSVQFLNGLSQQYNSLFENCCTSLLVLLRDYAKTKRVAAITGESSRGMMREFTGEDLGKINRVVVEQANPLTKTVAGRMELLTQLMSAGVLKDPRAMITLLNTGNLDACIEDTSQQQLLLRSENERLRQGQPVAATILDFHPDHIREHMGVIADPNARENPELLQGVFEHCMEHINLWRQAPPDILAIMGIQPLAPQQIPQQAPQQTPAQAGEAPAMQPDFPAAQPNMPNMPNLPQQAPAQSQQAYEQINNEVQK